MLLIVVPLINDQLQLKGYYPSVLSLLKRRYDLFIFICVTVYMDVLLQWWAKTIITDLCIMQSIYYMHIHVSL